MRTIPHWIWGGCVLAAPRFLPWEPDDGHGHKVSAADGRAELPGLSRRLSASRHRDVYSRREDAEDIRKTWVDAEDGRVITATMRCHGDNPSARRNAVGISFWCETCQQTNELTLSRHKGQTEVEWRNGGVRCP